MSGLPGQRTGYTASPRNIFYARGGEVYLPGPTVLDATYAYDGKNTNQTDEIRAGMMMAQITSSKLWVPCRRTTVAAGGSGSGTGAGDVHLNVVNASAFKAGETVHVVVAAGQGNQAGDVVLRTISSIDYDNDIITLTTAVQVSTGNAVTADSGGALAGAEIPRGILAQTVRMLSPEPFNTTQYDTPGVILSGGFMDVSMLLGDYAACRAAATNYLDLFLWSDQQAG